MPSIFKSASRKEKPTKPAKSFSVPSRDRASGTHTPEADVPGSPRIVAYTEFGRLKQAQPPRTPALPPTPTPFDSPASPYAAESPPILPPKYTFAPTRLPTITAANSIDSFAYSQDEATKPRCYGFLGGIGAKVTLGLDEVGGVVRVVGKELERRALTTPMLFSSQALELSATRVRALIQSYLDCLRSNSSGRREAWTRDLQFAREHELAWMLRWALSRISRLKEGTRDVSHGVLEWEAYEEWRGRERAANYPHIAYPYLSAIVPAEVYHLIVTPLLSLLSRFAAHSHLSGLTPHALSSLFAPFFFDIPTSSPCLVAHASYIRAASATEHLLLSYIRWTGRGEGLGVTDLPGRLRGWVAGYPAMVASDADLARASPRRGARSVRCERASRTVRAYSKDLITAAELWANDVDSWPAWENVLLKTRRGEASRPKFSAGWKKRMAVKDYLPLPTKPSAANHDFAYGQAQRPIPALREEKKYSGRADDGQEALWGSLAGKEWSMFEEVGFEAPDLSLTPVKREDMRERLQFDLNESAKMSVSDRRKTMEWTDFAAPTGGFTRTDPVLDVSLSFATPLSSSINEWPKEREDLHRRLHKSQKAATPFNYDTTPRVGADIVDPNARADQHGRVYIEESFVDWWADWGMGGGWIDKDELTFREASWALIEYKAKPSRPQDNSHDPLGDPRTSDLYFLFEENVPVEYQMAIANPQEKRTFATLFSARKKRNNANSPTKGTRGSSGSGWEDHEFDRMLHRNGTKKLTASRSEPPHASVWEMGHDPRTPTGPVGASEPPRSPFKAERSVSNGSGHMVEGKANFFSKNKDRVVRRVKTEEGQRDRAKIQRGQEVDFELASASGLSSPGSSPEDGERKNDDKWMDILVANGARRMDRQDAEPPRARSRPTASPIPPHQAGLPVSPHPPARQPSPALPRQVVSPGHLAPYAQQSDPAAHNTGLTHSPETSGSDAEVEAVTPRAGAEVQRWGSGRRKPVPSIEAEMMEELGDGRRPSQDMDRSEGPIPPVKDRAQAGELLAPSPRWQRDTITGIVDGYRDSVATTGTAQTAGTASMTDGTERRSSEMEESEVSFAQEQETEYKSRFKGDGFAAEGSPYKLPRKDEVARQSRTEQCLGLETGGLDVRDDDDEEEEHLVEEERDEEARDEMLDLPKMSGPVFDLTPGREPSPARYRHGEPLQFVGEEPEEEEY